MAAPTKLFLKFKNDSKFHIVDQHDQTIGAAYEIPEAIQEARKKSHAPIDIEDSYAGFSRLCVAEKPDDAEPDTENFIAALAEIGGMKVTKLFDDNMHFIGYTMHLAEDEPFIEAELLAEQHENELVNAMGSYFGDD